jgi:hypothetical protein
MSSILERNLLALSISSPGAARMIQASSPRADIDFVETGEGLSAALVEGGRQRRLASARRPLEEARALAGTVDPKQAATAVVLGFGVGHHVRAVAERLGPTSAVFVFEPDLGLLRAVLERVDHSGWLRRGNVVLLTDAEDGGAIAAATKGVEGLIGLGLEIVHHPASRARLGASAQRFAEEFARVVGAIKTGVVTTLMQTEVTFRNLLMNVDRYASCPGVAEIAGAARGKPAIVVSAGPSLRRNIELLSKPGMRERFVIIAVQTVLKTLLSRGVRPHFVTALDYHEISRRFYEGLTAEDVAGVTLVAEAKANPAILEAFPGEVRMPREGMLDELLGEGLSRERGELRPGATVAHLAYYLARHLGCDPVIMIGQDLGFTDGQYYAPGAAIHGVWSGELNAFNTLEMMEWQRIVRMRTRLHAMSDVHGRPIYSDEQMVAYLVQFERDFKGDGERGLTTIDATEGGVAKRHTRAMTLAEAVERFGDAGPARLPLARSGDAGVPPALERRLRDVRRDVWKVAEESRRTGQLLEQMLGKVGDHRTVNELIAKVEETRDRVVALNPAFRLVDQLNQTGTLKRVRADRQIALERDLPALDRQRRQIERDIVNVRWMADAADRLGELLDVAVRALKGGPKLTRDMETPAGVAAGGNRGPRRICAMVAVDFSTGGMGTARALETEFMGASPLRLTVQRLSRARELDGVVVLTSEPERAAQLIGDAGGPRVEIVRTQGSPLGARSAAIRAGRLWARSCWRAGLGGLSVYDEALAPEASARATIERGYDAAAVVGADWCLVDPALVNEAVARFRSQPEGESGSRFTFVQAPPGLGTCVIGRSLMQELAEKAAQAGVFATIGAMLGYVPIAPLPDPIARTICVAAEPPVRDAQFRFIPDSTPRRSALARALAGLDLTAASAGQIAERVRERQLQPPAGAPQELVLEPCTGRRTSGPRGVWLRGSAESVERPVLSLSSAERIFAELGEAREDAAVTFAGAGDPLLHPDVLKMIALARRYGIAGVHLRTDLACEGEMLERLLDAGPDVISIDLMAETPETYRRLMGADLFSRVRENLQRLIELRQSRPSAGGLPAVWIVPRITRCDQTYAEIEAFYDRWLLGAGAAVIDALPVSIPGERIEPLPLPALASRRMMRERMAVLCDGSVPGVESDFSGERCVGNVLKEGLMPVWRRLVARRYEVLVEPRVEGAQGGATRSRAVQLERGL